MLVVERGGVLALPGQLPQLCNIIWCDVNKASSNVCTPPQYQCYGENVRKHSAQRQRTAFVWTDTN